MSLGLFLIKCDITQSFERKQKSFTRELEFTLLDLVLILANSKKTDELSHLCRYTVKLKVTESTLLFNSTSDQIS